MDKNVLVNIDELSFGQKLKVKRQAEGVLLRDLAEHVGCSVPTLSNIETGKNKGYVLFKYGEKLSKYLYQERWANGQLIEVIKEDN